MTADRPLDEHGRKVLRGKRYYPETLVFRGRTYYPRQPSRIVMGEDSWIPDQSHLRFCYGDEPGTIIVACPDDPQILFPPAEVWFTDPTLFQRVDMGLT